MSTGTVISFPIPLYQNVPIQSYYFVPSQFFIENIALGPTTTVTATTDMNYVIGQQVRLLIPASFGCIQLNGLQGYVIAIPNTNEVTINIDSSVGVDSFIASEATTKAQILAIGDINTGFTSATGPIVPLVTVPGSFINISPDRFP